MRTTSTAAEVATAFFNERLPEDWFDGPATVTVDSEEVLVIGRLEGDEDPRAFRERTRHRRMEIADEGQDVFGRTVSWGVETGEHRHLFTTVSVPVMTRLRQRERLVLDTLIAAGVARSRSDALGWCVRLVAKHEREWIASLKEALVAVEKARAEGPDVV